MSRRYSSAIRGLRGIGVIMGAVRVVAFAAAVSAAAGFWWWSDQVDRERERQRAMQYIGLPNLSVTAGPHASRPRFQPLPAPPPVSEAKRALGERLFFEPRLSADNSISCASCHELARGGADHRRVSVGVGGALGNVNAPTVFNAALSIAQFWDGRASTLEEQAAGPVHNPVEMASSWPQVLAKLRLDTSYVEAFAQVYPGQAMTGERIVDAIATYERSLLTESRFDRFLRGDSAALGTLEQAGYQRFQDFGCASCHQGALLGGNMFQRFGVMADYFAGKPVKPADLGRFNVTGREEDRHVFKVPSLRNVAVTPPYFHDGSAETLDEAIVVMGRYQLGRELEPADVAALSAFLGALTGEWQGREFQ